MNSEWPLVSDRAFRHRRWWTRSRTPTLFHHMGDLLSIAPSRFVMGTQLYSKGSSGKRIKTSALLLEENGHHEAKH